MTDGRWQLRLKQNHAREHLRNLLTASNNIIYLFFFHKIYFYKYLVFLFYLYICLKSNLYATYTYAAITPQIVGVCDTNELNLFRMHLLVCLAAKHAAAVVIVFHFCRAY